MPKDCIDCPCESEYYCNLLNEDVGCCKWGEIHKNCPLKSIAEHNKAKDHQIELLNKRWELLKEYINGFKEYNIEEANMAWILTDKMKELEQEKL